jgi:hypothetical protein
MCVIELRAFPCGHGYLEVKICDRMHASVNRSIHLITQWQSLRDIIDDFHHKPNSRQILHCSGDRVIKLVLKEETACETLGLCSRRADQGLYFWVADRNMLKSVKDGVVREYH